MSSESFLTLKAGSFQCVSRATIKGATRHINISDCPVDRWSDLKGDTISSSDEVDLSIYEMTPGEPLWKEDPEKIGAFSKDSMHINVHLPREAFHHFWTAAEATYDAPPYIEIVLKPGDPKFPQTLSVTNVGLIEAMPSKMHPVVAELRIMGETLSGLIRSLVIWVYIGLAVWILLSIFRWFSS